MFGKKKKEKLISVMHYSGIQDFACDYPVQMEITDSDFIIRRLKPETTVTLPLNRIKSFSAMEEKNFMQRYQGTDKTTSKCAAINKYYLVVEYDKGTLVFWGTAKECKTFIDLQYKNNLSAPTKIEL